MCNVCLLVLKNVSKCVQLPQPFNIQEELLYVVSTEISLQGYNRKCHML